KKKKKKKKKKKLFYKNQANNKHTHLFNDNDNDNNNGDANKGKHKEGEMEEKEQCQACGLGNISDRTQQEDSCAVIGNCTFGAEDQLVHVEINRQAPDVSERRIWSHFKGRVLLGNIDYPIEQTLFARIPKWQSATSKPQFWTYQRTLYLTNNFLSSMQLLMLKIDSKDIRIVDFPQHKIIPSGHTASIGTVQFESISNKSFAQETLLLTTNFSLFHIPFTIYHGDLHFESAHMPQD
ncbi:hypothetical protein RFI_39117, partial [Reticulomyxa filosa]